MAYGDALNLLLAAGVWCAAYMAVAVLASCRIFYHVCGGSL
ncbi:unnamed protein product [Malus baccata var. baccata]